MSERKLTDAEMVDVIHKLKQLDHQAAARDVAQTVVGERLKASKEQITTQELQARAQEVLEQA